MALAFDLTDPTLEAGLQRIARALLRKSIGQIDTAAALESPTVHDLRKTIKKLRAALRLLWRKCLLNTRSNAAASSACST